MVTANCALVTTVLVYLPTASPGWGIVADDSPEEAREGEKLSSQLLRLRVYTTAIDLAASLVDLTLKFKIKNAEHGSGSFTIHTVLN